jgi:hypothetical protein
MILEFCPDLTQRVKPIDNPSNHADEHNLKKRNESSKQHEDNQHAKNLSLIILDEHNNLHINIFDKIDDGSAVPGGCYTQHTNQCFV